jgi:hypothetical protein
MCDYVLAEGLGTHLHSQQDKHSLVAHSFSLLTRQWLCVYHQPYCLQFAWAITKPNWSVALSSMTLGQVSKNSDGVRVFPSVARPMSRSFWYS